MNATAAAPPAMAKEVGSVAGMFKKDAWVVCYNITSYTRGENEMPRDQDVLERALPNTVMQLALAMAITRFFMFVLKPLRQPRIIADILGGLMLGPTGIGGLDFSHDRIVPFFNQSTLETLANLGLVYYMFILGLELDLKPVIRAGKKALTIALAGILVSIPVGCALLYFVLIDNFSQQIGQKGKPNHLTMEGPIFWGFALASTSFPELARILSDTKLLHTDIGRLALSSAVISDLCSWFLLVFALATVGDNHRWTTLVFTATFLGFCVYVVRPYLARVAQNATKNAKNNDNSNNIRGYEEFHVCIILSGVVLCGFITDMCGAHSILGPFVLGAIVPKEGGLKKKLRERLESFVTQLMMPLFFICVGLRVNVEYILTPEGTHDINAPTHTSGLRVAGVMLLGFAAKVVSSFVAGLCNKLSCWDSLTLGILMNTRGLLSLIILSNAKDMNVLDNRAFAVMVIAICAMMAPVAPFLTFIYKPTMHSTQHKLRNIQSLPPSTELAILTCAHSSSSVPGIINLIEASNPSKQSPISAFSVQLVELTGNTSAMLIVHDACKPNADFRASETQPDYIISNNAFVNYVRRRENVRGQVLTVVSPYNTMHVDICNLAEENFINLIIIPFHMQTTIDGVMEDSNPNLKDTSKNMIESAPCSIGVFVDRGFSVAQVTESSRGGGSSLSYNNFAMFFIGGEDDREALAYAWRTAGHPRVNLTVVRLIVIPTNEAPNNDENKNKDPEAMEKTKMQKQLSDAHIDDFRLKSMHKPTVQYMEEVVTSWEEIINLVRAMDSEYDLYIVGRRHGSTSPATALSDYCSDPDELLGPMGEALVFSDFTLNTSILVLQEGAMVDELEGI